jgi:carboxyl-terminal processing protease
MTSERDLPGHLKGENETDASAKDSGNESIGDDYALNEAVHVLKAMALKAPVSGEKKG